MPIVRCHATKATVALAWTLAALIVCAAIPPAIAGRQVLLRDFRTIIADDVRTEGDVLVLEMGQGNQVRLPAELVLEIHEYTPPPPPPVVAEPGARIVAFGPPMPHWRDRAGAYATAVEKTATQYKLPPELLVAVALTESRFDSLALSRKGAQGVMQLMPGTARVLRVGDVWDAHQNLEAGARWLRRLLDKFDGDVDLALAAYNAGEEAVKRFGGIPPYRETQLYVQRIRALVRGFAEAS